MTEHDPKALERQITALEEENFARKAELARLRKAAPRQEACESIGKVALRVG